MPEICIYNVDIFRQMGPFPLTCLTCSPAAISRIFNECPAILYPIRQPLQWPSQAISMCSHKNVFPCDSSLQRALETPPPSAALVFGDLLTHIAKLQARGAGEAGVSVMLQVDRHGDISIDRYVHAYLLKLRAGNYDSTRRLYVYTFVWMCTCVI